MRQYFRNEDNPDNVTDDHGYEHQRGEVFGRFDRDVQCHAVPNDGIPGNHFNPYIEKLGNSAKEHVGELEDVGFAGNGSKFLFAFLFSLHFRQRSKAD